MQIWAQRRGIFGKAGSKNRNKDWKKLGANHFSAIAKPVNDTNQSGQSVLPIIRQVNKMIINVEMAAI
jgi:hypothetical protein